MSANPDPFQRKYDERQLTAVYFERFDTSPRPSYKQIRERAKAGVLRHPDGKPVPAFNIPHATVARYCQAERNRRLGRHPDRPDEYTDPDAQAVAARAVAWAIVGQDLRQVKALGKAKPEQIEKRQGALQCVLKNIAVLQKLEPDAEQTNGKKNTEQPGPAQHTEQAPEDQAKSPAERLADAARAEPSTLDPTQDRAARTNTTPTPKPPTAEQPADEQPATEPGSGLRARFAAAE